MEKVVIVIEADTKKALKGVKDLNKSVTETKKTAKATGKGLASSFKGFSSAVSGAIPMLGKLKTALISTGVGALVVALGSLVAFFKSAADVGANFEKSLSTLKAVTGSTSDALSSLSSQAKELGATTQFTAIEVLGLQTELAKLGFTVKDIENSTPAILDLASSLEVDLASAAELAGSVVRSFGLDTKETQRVVDVMSLSTSSSALNFESLRESLKLVAPTSRATGVSIEKTAALLGVLANNGLKGSVAGTGLSKTFIELNSKGLTLEQGMEKVKNSTNKLNTAIDLVGVVGAKSFLSLAESGEQISQLEKDFEGAEGAAKRMAEVRLDNLTGDTTKLSSAWEGFLLNLEDGDGIINTIQRGAIQLLTKGISGLTVVVDYLSFVFSDAWKNISDYTEAGGVLISGQLDIILNTFKFFGNGVLLQVSKIPFIGKSIDKSLIESNMNNAKKEILKGVQKLEDGFNKIKKVSNNIATTQIRFQISQIEKINKKASNDELDAMKKASEEKLELQKTLSDEEKERIKKQRENLDKLEAKIKKQIEDSEDKTALEKAERKRERALKEVEAIKLSESEKREAIKSINEYYDTVEAEAKIIDDEVKKANEDKENAEKLKKADEIAKEEIRISKLVVEQKRLLQQSNLNNMANGFALLGQLAGKNKALQAAAIIGESAVGIARTIIQTQASNVATTAQGAALAIPTAGASVAAAASLVAANNIGAGIGIAANIGATAKALSGLKAGGSPPSKGSNPSQPPTTVPSIPPSFNVVGASDTNQLAGAIGGQSQQPVKAYVVSNDVTSAQSMDRNIVESASI